MPTGTLLTPEDAIPLPADVLGSDDPDDIIGANIDVLNALFSEYLGITDSRRFPTLFTPPRRAGTCSGLTRTGSLDRTERIAQTLNNEPDCMKRIRALCSEAGQELEQVTAGDRLYPSPSSQSWIRRPAERLRPALMSARGTS
ncbi:hypothetical protein SAMN05877962_105135 [Alloalcanivorax xenomutans]|nr:hypothetical protein SAMN05877962_105135 [Alloalcanivorax xenomutans]